MKCYSLGKEWLESYLLESDMYEPAAWPGGQEGQWNPWLGPVIERVAGLTSQLS